MFDPQSFERDKRVYRCDDFSEQLKDAVRFFHGTMLKDVYVTLKKKYHPLWNRLMPKKIEKNVLDGDSAKMRIRRYLDAA